MNTKIKYFLLLTINLSFMLTGCNSNDTADDVSNPAADIDSEVYSQKSWDILSPEAQETDTIEGYSDVFSEIMGIDEYACSNEQHSLTTNPKEFISIQPDTSIVWLGN